MRVRPRACSWPMIAAAILLATGCRPSPSELVVEVNSDLVVPTELDSIEVSLRSRAGALLARVWRPLATGQLPHKPLRFIVRAVDVSDADGEERTVWILGLRGGGPAVTAARSFRFVEGQSVHVLVPLVRACSRVTCPAAHTTCGEGGVCRNVQLDASELRPYVPGSGPLPFMGGSGLPGPDAGAPDAIDDGTADAGDAGEDPGLPVDAGGDVSPDADTDPCPAPTIGFDGGCAEPVGYAKPFNYANIVSAGYFGLHRVTLSRPATLLALGTILANTGIGTQIRMALYSAVDGKPADLLAQSGPTPVQKGRMVVPVEPRDLAAGDYWIGLNAESTTRVLHQIDEEVEYRYLPLRFDRPLPTTGDRLLSSRLGGPFNFFFVVR